MPSLMVKLIGAATPISDETISSAHVFGSFPTKAQREAVLPISRMSSLRDQTPVILCPSFGLTGRVA
jgi:hypothetical protein